MCLNLLYSGKIRHSSSLMLSGSTWTENCPYQESTWRWKGSHCFYRKQDKEECRLSMSCTKVSQVDFSILWQWPFIPSNRPHLLQEKPSSANIYQMRLREP